MNNPLVSIIIPVFNGANYLRESIDSALSQTYKDIEIIVVNDGSTDNSEDIVLSYGSRVKYFSKKNGGVASALNLAIHNASGEYISWLSHDDLYAKDKISTQIERLKALDDKDTLIYSDYIYIDEKSSIVGNECIGSRHNIENLNSAMYPLLMGIIHGCTLLIRKRLYLHYGLFDETLKTTQDYDLWFKMLTENPICFIDRPLVLSRTHSQQSSKKMKVIHLEESNKLWEKVINSIEVTQAGENGSITIGLLFLLYNRLRGLELYESARVALFKAVDSTERDKNVLLVTATLDGGLGRFVHDLNHELGEFMNAYILKVSGLNFQFYYGDILIYNIALTEKVLLKEMYDNIEVSGLLGALVETFQIGIVHLNGFFYLGFKAIEMLKVLNVPAVLTVHDFHMICFSQFFLNKDSKYCGLNKDLDVCSTCLLSNQYSDWLGPKDGRDLDQYRSYIQRNILPELSRMVFPSEFARRVFLEYYPKIDLCKTTIIEHGLPQDSYIPVEAITNAYNGKLGVGIIGNIRAHKGLNFITEITSRANKEQFQFVLFGECSSALPGVKVIPFEKYEKMVGMIKRENLSIALVLSEAPETFSYALSECWGAGVPVIVTDVGALKDRMNSSNGGFVVNRNNAAEEVLVYLNDFIRNPEVLIQAKRNVEDLILQSTSEMASSYAAIYKEAEKNRLHDITSGSGHEAQRELLAWILQAAETRGHDEHVKNTESRTNLKTIIVRVKKRIRKYMSKFNKRTRGLR